MSTYRPLSSEEIQIMEGAGCQAADWSRVEVGEGFDPHRVRRVSFSGAVQIGALQGLVEVAGGVELPAELADAVIADCTLGDHVRISQVRGYLAHYDIGDGAVIADVGAMVTRPGATFGNGVEVETVNEGGGREVRIFSEMSSQFAYLYAMHRYRPRLIEKLEAMVDAYVDGVRADRGSVGSRAVVTHVGEVIDVNIGPCATVCGAAALRNGTLRRQGKAAVRRQGG